VKKRRIKRGRNEITAMGKRRIKREILEKENNPVMTPLGR
jgi:hypothetical protein